MPVGEARPLERGPGADVAICFTFRTLIPMPGAFSSSVKVSTSGVGAGGAIMFR